MSSLITTSRALYRTEKGKVLFGVCSGLAEHFDIDAVLVRLIFVVLSLVNGLGIIIYAVLWLVLPKGIRVASEEAEIWRPTGETASAGEDLGEDLEAKHEEEESKEVLIIDRRSPFVVYLVLGLVPVLVGMVFLLDRFFESMAFFPGIWVMARIFWPAILVIAGLVIVVAGAVRKQ